MSTNEAINQHTSYSEKRRQISLSLASLLGLSINVDTLALVFTKNEDGEQVLNDGQLMCTAALAEILLPETDTPGAIGAGVPIYLNQHLQRCIPLQRQQSFVRGLAKVNSVAYSRFKQEFALLKLDQQIQLVSNLEDVTGEFDQVDKEFWMFFKSLTLFAYYTSEVGATQELAYLPMPGGYKGKFPFSQIGKAWAT